MLSFLYQYRVCSTATSRLFSVSDRTGGNVRHYFYKINCFQVFSWSIFYELLENICFYSDRSVLYRWCLDIVLYYVIPWYIYYTSISSNTLYRIIYHFTLYCNILYYIVIYYIIYLIMSHYTILYYMLHHNTLHYIM